MLELLLAFASAIAPEDQSLRDALTSAVQRPLEYLQTHSDTAERLSAEADPAASADLPLLASVDELIGRQRAVELDWRTGREDLLWSLGQLANYAMLSPTRRAALARLDCDDALTINWLRAVAAQLGDDDWIVAVLDIDSDSYVVLLLRSAQFAAVKQRTDALGWTFDDIRRHDPNTFR